MPAQSARPAAGPGELRGLLSVGARHTPAVCPLGVRVSCRTGRADSAGPQTRRREARHQEAAPAVGAAVLSFSLPLVTPPRPSYDSSGKEESQWRWLCVVLAWRPCPSVLTSGLSPHWCLRPCTCSWVISVLTAACSWPRRLKLGQTGLLVWNRVAAGLRRPPDSHAGSRHMLSCAVMAQSPRPGQCR